MVEETRGRPFLRSHKRAVRGALVSIASATLVVPPVILAVSAQPGALAQVTAMRILALYAFTLIFLNIATGALAPRFNAYFKPLTVYRFHIRTGVLGFLLAVSHGTIVIAYGYYRGHNPVWAFGPVALGLLAVAIWAALDKRRLPRVWRRIHQVNYLIFAGIFVKAMLVGSDLGAHGHTGATLALDIIFGAYVAVAAVATAVRIRDSRVIARKRRESRGAQAAPPTGTG